VYKNTKTIIGNKNMGGSTESNTVPKHLKKLEKHKAIILK